VRLSAFTVVDDYPELGSGRDRYSEVLQLAQACERSGVSALWVAEHHFHSGGVCPAPPVLLAAIGARTERLRLGVLVSVLPFHSPIELAEQYALLDRLLHGRLNLGVGSGYIPLEFEGFGLSPETKRERFDRNLSTLLSALAGEPVRTDGGGGSLVQINVRPVQQPHPPIRVAVQRREAVRFLAERGFSIALIPYATVSGVPELAEEVREYRQHLPAGVRGDVAVALHLYVGADLAPGREAHQRYLDSRRATQSANYEALVREDPRRALSSSIEAAGFALFGSAEGIVERLRPFAEAGVDEILGIFDFGGLAPELVERSVASLAEAWSDR
jgi:alkanesulfonate monooxygenase SsuD/methylene tetrahydromethanopterin reductase-like flavin-dependent oxidoreductase (luciferase family)